MNSAPEVDQLADALDRVLPPHTQAVPDHVSGVEAALGAGIDAPLDGALAAALQLARDPRPVLPDDMAARIEARVLAQVQPQTRPYNQPQVQMRRRVLALARWAAAACLVLVIVTLSAASVSADSLPGDMLYPVKRLVERGRLVLASESSDVGLRLEFADRRLDEFETLLGKGLVETDVLVDAVDDMDSTLRLVERGAGSSADAVRVVELSERHMQLAETARESDPAQADALRQTAESASAVHEKARQLVEPSAGPQANFPAMLFTLGDHRPLPGSGDPAIPNHEPPNPTYPADPSPTTIYFPPTAAQVESLVGANESVTPPGRFGGTLYLVNSSTPTPAAPGNSDDPGDPGDAPFTIPGDSSHDSPPPIVDDSGSSGGVGNEPGGGRVPAEVGDSTGAYHDSRRPGDGGLPLRQ